MDGRRGRARAPAGPARSPRSPWIPPIPREHRLRGRRQRRRLEDHRLPDQQPRRADLDPPDQLRPEHRLNISSIAIFPGTTIPPSRSSSPPPAAPPAGESNTDAPGVGFLISDDGGTTWNVYDSTDNVSNANGNLLPIDSAARDREFVGTTAYQVAVDPQPTPTGGVIIYAALSGTNGGIWRSEDTGQTWTQVLAGNATAVVLDQDSGIVLDPTTGTDVQGNLQIVYAGIEGTGVST